MSQTNKEEIVDKVLYPGSVQYTLCGKGIEQHIAVLPLPIFYAKQVNRRLGSIQKRIKDVIEKQAILLDKEKTEGKIDPDLLTKTDDVDLDMDFVDAVIDAAIIILSFYDVLLTKDQIEKNIPLNNLTGFLEKQMEVSNDHDFLLQGLSAAILLVRSIGAMGESFRNLLMSVRSVSPGERAFTPLSELTQPVS